MSAKAATPPAKKQRVGEPPGDAKRVSSSASASASAPTTAAAAAPSTPTSFATKPLAKAKFCLNCQKELARNIRVTCVECTARRPPVELCIECFAVGIELGDHKKTHRYSVSDCLAFPVVREPRELAAVTTTATTTAAGTASATPQKDDDAAAAATNSTGTPSAAPAAQAPVASDWTVDEELLLLEGIEMFGMGNWKDIAEHVTTKSEKKCETHYMGAYLSTSDLLPRFLADHEPLLHEPLLVDEPKPSGAGTVATTAGSTSVGASTPSTTPIIGLPPTIPGSELAGYMPLRGDFDVEYDNEAELILADMEFAVDDHPTERELKLKVIEIYNAKLDERERRKRFVIERGLLDYKRHQQTERRRPKDERELIAQMRPFARYQTPKEHDDFVNGLVSAMRLRKQILLLQEYRKSGVRTLAEAELYDVEKKKRETEQALQKQRDSAAYLYESNRPASSGRDRANRWLTRDQAAGGDTNTPSDKNGRDVPEHTRTRGGAGSSANATANGSNGSSGGGESAATAGAASFLVDGAPGYHMLTPQEKELCSKLKLLPKVRCVWLVELKRERVG